MHPYQIQAVVAPERFAAHGVAHMVQGSLEPHLLECVHLDRWDSIDNARYHALGPTKLHWLVHTKCLVMSVMSVDSEFVGEPNEDMKCTFSVATLNTFDGHRHPM